jgi:gas vesicle protein
MDVRSFFFGALAGAVVGGVTALLLAPRSGKETREMLMEKVSMVQDKAKDLGETISRMRPGARPSTEQSPDNGR